MTSSYRLRLYRKAARQARPRSARRPLLVIEQLEDRLLLANWSGDVFDTTPGLPLWTNGEVQQIVGEVHVPAGKTLTVQAGTVVKFNGALSLTVDGTLVAQGTAASPIVFTSYRDGAGAVGGDWAGLVFASGSSGNVLDHVDVRYGGYSSVVGAEVLVQNAGLSLTNSVLHNSGRAGLRIVGSNPVVTGNTFEDNPDGAISMDLASSPSISGSTLIHNGVNGVAVDSGLMTANVTWNSPDIVYRVHPVGITVAADTTLTIGAGQIIKFAPPSFLAVNGSLHASGTDGQPILFTSDRDDTGGDTNNDANLTSGAPGDWAGLSFGNGSGGNLLDHVEVRYGGYSSFLGAQVAVQNAELSLTNSVLRNSYRAGLRIVGSNPVVTGNTFQDNAEAAISMDLASSPSVSSSTLIHNAVNGVAVDSGIMTSSVTWNSPDIPFRVHPVGIIVAAGATLNIGAAQIVKFAAGFPELTISGKLLAVGTATAPIIFTSERDDSMGGDTNNDGSLTSGVAGSWAGLHFASGSSGNVLDHVEVRYGGSNSFLGSQVFVNNAGLTMTNSVVRNSLFAGLRALGSNPVVTGNTFQDNGGAAISMDLASDPVTDANTQTGNGFNGIKADSGTLAASLSWTSPDLYTVAGDVTVPSDLTLTIGPSAAFILPNYVNYVTFSGTGTIANGGTFITAQPTTYIVPQIVNTGIMQPQSGNANVGSVIVNGSGVLAGQTGANLNISGHLTGDTRNADQFAPLATVNLTGWGTAAEPQLLEAMSLDLGAVADGFGHNFVYHTLVLGNGTYVRLVDNADNFTGAGSEAVYADNLVVPPGCTLDLNGLHVYTRNAQIRGTVVGGTVTTLSSGGTLRLNAPTTGTLAIGTVDDWTFFARADQAITLTLGTGDGSSIPPLQPAINFGQLTLTEGGTTLGVASNDQSGAEVTLAGAIEPVQGFLTPHLVKQYHVQVQARPAQPNSSGNYVIIAWDATPHTAPLTLDQTTNGTIDNPYRTEQWTFTGTAGQLVQFKLIPSLTSAIQFDLTGPNGYAGFNGATGSSGQLTLPDTGAYTITAHGNLNNTGNYAFRLESDTIIDLTLGMPYQGAFSGNAQAQLFRVNVPEAGQLRINLQDPATLDRNELYVSLVRLSNFS